MVFRALTLRRTGLATTIRAVPVSRSIGFDPTPRIALSGIMARKPNPLESALQDVVRGAIANEDRAAARKAREDARRQEREADAALAAADPQAAMRERLTQIEAQLAGLKLAHQQKGDALAGRLVQTLELERTQLLSRLRR
jgi:hypothetical protein